VGKTLEQVFKLNMQKEPIITCLENEYIEKYYSPEYVDWLKKEIKRMKEVIKIKNVIIHKLRCKEMDDCK